MLGYTAEVAVSEDHFIVAQRVTQNKNDNHALIPMVDEVERQCGEKAALQNRPKSAFLRKF